MHYDIHKIAICKYKFRKFKQDDAYAIAIETHATMTLITYNYRNIIFYKYTRVMVINYDAYNIVIENKQASNMFTNYDDTIIIDKTKLACSQLMMHTTL